MGFLDRLLGREESPPARPAPGPSEPADPDQQAVDRYQYLLRTAPPDRIEAAHAEAFAQLTPEQRRLALDQLTSVAAPGEAPPDDSPAALARSATRTEVQQPGALNRAFGGGGGAGAFPGMGTVLLTSVAGAFVGTAVAQSLMGSGLDGGAGEGSEGGEGDAGADGTDGSTADGGSADAGSGDAGSGDGGGWWGGDSGGSTDAGLDSGFDGGGFDGGF